MILTKIPGGTSSAGARFRDHRGWCVFVKDSYSAEKLKVARMQAPPFCGLKATSARKTSRFLEKIGRGP